MTLPLPLRNRLAHLILDALHDEAARRGLQTVAAVCADPRALDTAAAPPEGFPAELFDRRPDGWRIRSGFAPHAAALGERAARAARALAGRPLAAADPPLAVALDEAATLFEAGLYFETHEVLEPFWTRAEGAEREALQGLIQVAVGFQHLANGNLDGARALLRDGATRVAGHRLEGRVLSAFAAEVARCLGEVIALGGEATARFDWSRVPRFPVGG
ncbi:MAG TPA: DUF309 domain-containing protein [Methylomirabilota bacterium]|nr:DUF309 domain-containing protein [Methylomirabilota bacterium]